MNIKTFRTDFESIATAVKEITETENTFVIEANSDGYERACELTNFSNSGLKSLGVMVGFPAPFVQKVAQTNPELAEKIVRDRMENYFFHDEKPDFRGREFLGKIQGVVSKNYSYFDDNEVIDILSDTPIRNLPFMGTMVTPERLHLRAIDPEPFHIDGDNSDLHFMYFIDNSMIGNSAFKVRFGIFRRVCSNGLIVPKSEFTLCKQIHKGEKDIAAEFNSSLEFLAQKKGEIRDMLLSAVNEPAKIEKLAEEMKRDFLAKKLNLNKKEAEKVMNLFTITYGGKTKWAMVNAITEFARDTGDISRRTYLESRALAVA